MNAPCYNCSRRRPRCHAECKEYAAWKQDRDQERMENRPPHTDGHWKSIDNALQKSVKNRKYGKFEK